LLETKRKSRVLTECVKKVKESRKGGDERGLGQSGVPSHINLSDLKLEKKREAVSDQAGTRRGPKRGTRDDGEAHSGLSKHFPDALRDLVYETELYIANGT